ncbi:MAG: hypothetical protein LBL69_04775 [Zoogloeaceae bacterium]|jgi:hypothetical protein|nr:hypothetical protein [Zoogloeaceae bacterium]
MTTLLYDEKAPLYVSAKRDIKMPKAARKENPDGLRHEQSCKQNSCEQARTKPKLRNGGEWKL